MLAPKHERLMGRISKVVVLPVPSAVFLIHFLWCLSTRTNLITMLSTATDVDVILLENAKAVG
jgi:hypothetical protein